MPVFIKTPADEKRWQKAKQAANKTLNEGDGDRYWALVNSIYQKMKKTDIVLDTLQKFRDQLSKVNEDDISEEDLEGMQIIDPEKLDEEDEAARFIQEQEAKQKEPTKKPVRSLYKEWQPQEKYSPEHQEAMDKYLKEGYTHREAEYLAGAHGGPKTLQEALLHTVHPSEMSPKMLERLQPLAQEWVENARKHDYLTADPSKSPEKHVRGKILSAVQNYAIPFHDARQKFMESIKDLKGIDKVRAIRKFHKDYEAQNPEHAEGRQAIKEAHGSAKDIKEAANADLHEKMQHIMRGGVGMPVETTMAEAVQQAGGTKGEGGQLQTTIKKDPLAAFAEANPKLREAIQRASPEQQDRYKRVMAARTSQGISAQPVKEKVETPASGLLKDPANQKLLNQFVTEHAPLINLHSKKLQGAGKVHEGVESDDLHMAGFHGLMDALSRYKPGMGTKFSTYAGRRIAGKMGDHVVAAGEVPKEAMRRAANIRATEAAVAQPKKPEGEE